MLELVALSFLAQIFDKKKDTKDTLQPRGYNLTMIVDEKSFQSIKDKVKSGGNEAGEKMLGRLTEIMTNLENQKPNPLMGGYELCSWSDDACFDGMQINGHEFGAIGKTDTNMVMLQNVKCLCQTRVLKKKDGTSELIVNPLIVDTIGVEPAQLKIVKKK